MRAPGGLDDAAHDGVGEKLPGSGDHGVELGLGVFPVEREALVGLPDEAIERSEVARLGVDGDLDDHCPMMSNEDICALPVKDVTDPRGSILALWCPSSILDVGLRVLNAWGFTLKSSFVWVKTTKTGWAPVGDEEEVQFYEGEGTGLGLGMGRGFRQCHEVALIGTRGRYVPESKSERSVMLAYNEPHSTKPDELHRRLEKLCPLGPYLELFARRQQANKLWTCLGNEIDGQDIRFSLTDLALGLG